MNDTPTVMNRLLLTVLIASVLYACGGAEDDEAVSESEVAEDIVQINVRRSLVVNNTSILDQRFSMRRVLDQLAAQLSSGYTGATLFRDWWDTQNDAAHSQGGPVHCEPSLNDYPLECPRQEGVLAGVGLVDAGPDSWVPIALFNRFDLAPDNGAHCGEYRIEFGKRPRSIIGALDRTLVIFEAQMPNPNPEAGRDGCHAIVKFWSKLSKIENQEERAIRLEAFYFLGFPIDHDGDESTASVPLPPVISAAHFTSATGQIRSNQFMTLRAYFERGVLLQPWQLREFKLQPGCPGGACIAQVTTKNNPFGHLFSDNSTLPQAPAFKDFFATPGVIGRLASNNLNEIGMQVPSVFNTGESTQQGTVNDYITHFDPAGAFAGRIQAALETLPCDGDPMQPCPSALSPSHIVQRAGTVSCAGCHQLSNGDDLGAGLVWPASNVFTHVSERNLRVCEPFRLQGQCFLTSPALDSTFLPHRRAIMESFLADN